MRIKKIRLKRIALSLKTPFKTHQAEIVKRPAIIVEIEDAEGKVGYGEITAFPSPFYTAETTDTAWHIVVDILIPSIEFKEIHHPNNFHEQASSFQGNQMAKAGLEGALWDLYAKQQGVGLARLIGGTKEAVKAGAVISLSERMKEEIGNLLSQGYERFKLKVEKGKEEESIAAVRSLYPDLPLMIDANGMYQAEDLTRVAAFDEFGLLMIEQPFRAGDFYLHRTLQEKMETPICLDESIESYEDAEQAIELGSCRMMNIKISRVGGLTEALKIHDLCVEHHIPVWCGGMIETGISKAHNIALASLPNFTLPGDLSGSTRYFEKDIIKPFIEVDRGEIRVSDENGIGYEIDEDFLKQVTEEAYEYILE
ncbi:o-succinylbenzoate synthase [Halobacillus sp. A1]|uniref:o-succinylbenzoate synthase n=1 Tax=Halobacillus sp. A1 TaxID=2880262 RepID=UPI0020A676F7|nr:o-succinylbenzoate synthase [Halobacillus sp. A1]